MTTHLHPTGPHGQGRDGEHLDRLADLIIAAVAQLPAEDLAEQSADLAALWWAAGGDLP